MGGQLCHLVRGKEKGRHSCPRSLPGLYVQRSAPVRLPQAPIHLLCAAWTLHGAASRALSPQHSPPCWRYWWTWWKLRCWGRSAFVHSGAWRSFLFS